MRRAENASEWKHDPENYLRRVTTPHWLLSPPPFLTLSHFRSKQLDPLLVSELWLRLNALADLFLFHCSGLGTACSHPRVCAQVWLTLRLFRASLAKIQEDLSSCKILIVFALERMRPFTDSCTISAG